MTQENDTVAPLVCRDIGEMTFWTQVFMTVIGNPSIPRLNLDEALAFADGAVKEGRKRVPSVGMVQIKPKGH